MAKKNPLVFMDVCIDGDPKERMVFEVSSCFKFNLVGWMMKYLYVECCSCIFINLSMIFLFCSFSWILLPRLQKISVLCVQVIVTCYSSLCNDLTCDGSAVSCIIYLSSIDGFSS